MTSFSSSPIPTKNAPRRAELTVRYKAGWWDQYDWGNIKKTLSILSVLSFGKFFLADQIFLPSSGRFGSFSITPLLTASCRRLRILRFRQWRTQRLIDGNRSRLPLMDRLRFKFKKKELLFLSLFKWMCLTDRALHNPIKCDRGWMLETSCKCKNRRRIEHLWVISVWWWSKLTLCKLVSWRKSSVKKTGSRRTLLLKEHDVAPK